jgi:hypothetical protein
MKLLSILFVSLLSTTVLFSQNIGIGTQTPDASALLDVRSTDKGVLIPRLTTAQRNAIASPAKGLQVLNLDDMCTDIFDGAVWIKNCGSKAVAAGTADPSHPNPNSWVQKANFLAGRWGMSSFTINKKAYAGLGANTSDSPQSSLWEYNPLTNAWTQMANFPGVPRWYATGFTIAGKGYMGAGSNGTFYYSDCWEYDPTINSWTQKASLPRGRNYPFSFVIGNKAYVGGGLASNSGNDFYEFDPVANSWVTKTSPPLGTNNRYGAFAFAIGNKGYMGTGSSSGNNEADFWEYDPATNGWTQKANFGGGVRYGAAAFAINGKGYATTGHTTGNIYVTDLWSYDVPSNTWTQRQSFPGFQRIGAFGFNIGNKGYVGTGVNQNNVFGVDMWEYQDEVEVGTGYSSAPPFSPMDTYSDGRWTIAGNTVYNSNTGNVGIGVSQPTEKLQVGGTVKTIGLEANVLVTTGGMQFQQGAFNNAFLRSDAAGNTSWAAITETDPQVGSATTGRVPRWNGSTLADGTMFDNGSFIGIGTTTPHTYLQLPNGVAWRKLVLHEDADHDYMVYSLGIGAGTLRYQVPPGAAHSFLGGVNTSVNNEVMRIQANGNVGIGVGDAQARLHVAGGAVTTPNQQRAYFHVNTGSSIIQDVSSSGGIVMRVDGWVWANGGGFVATSDARIKNIIGVTDNSADLATLSKIDITNYKYKDEIANGAGVQKKVIAQQVKEIYPVAVNQSTGIIPNVFAVAKSIKTSNDATVITTAKPHEFSSGDEVKLIFNKSGEKIYTVTVIDAVTFSIPVATAEDIFVYGKKVSDLLNVDYDALTTLNISATQQLKKEIDELKAENRQLKADMQKQIADLIKRLEVFAGK